MVFGIVRLGLIFANKIWKKYALSFINLYSVRCMLR